MLFSSITFLYYYLPAVFVLYFVVPFRYKNHVLCLTSLFFYAWGEPVYVFLMCAFIVVGYAAGLLIEKNRSNARLWLILSCAVCLGLLGYFKYADFFVGNLNAITGSNAALPNVVLPIGISFYTFQILSYVIDVYRKQTAAQRSLIYFAAYASLFPQLIAGPIIRYSDVAAQLERRSITWEKAYGGVRRFLVGLSKKVLLANTLGALCAAFRSSGEKTVLFYWMYAAAFTLQIYFDFSGYSDMAIGLGKIFGFDFLENFDHPYVSKSITEFWRRWHISLGSWFRDYVYIPLGGNRVSVWKAIRNILVVWALTGLWHGAAWNFVLWGLLFAVLLIAEKFWMKRVLGAVPSVIRHVYVLFFLMVGFVLFNAQSLGQAASDLGGLFGLGNIPAFGRTSLYYLRSYAVVLMISIAASTPLLKKLYRLAACTAAGKRLTAVLEPAALCGLLALCTAYLVDGSFNPFLYFRF